MLMRDRTRRFDRWVRGSPPVLILGLVLLVVTAAGTIWTAGYGVWNWYERTYDWQARDYRKLSELRAGYTVGKFSDVLGAPTFTRLSYNKKWVEYTYQGRDSWVQAVTPRGSGTVAVFAVTSCSAHFNPTFTVPYGKTVQLNRETLAEVTASRQANISLEVRYQTPGATANAFYWEIISGGNPSNYKAFAWGYDDACNDRAWEKWDGFDVSLKYPSSSNGVFAPGGPFFTSRAVVRLRRRVVVNSYAETAPLDESFPSGENDFQIGVDRILTRTVINSGASG
jgi:hypothetical protein